MIRLAHGGSSRARPQAGRGGFRVALLHSLLLTIVLATSAASGQSIIHWTTNYYTITGRDFREIRRSMSEARPWKRTLEVDAITVWKVDWKFSLEPGAGGCQAGAIRLVTTITTTLPRYIPPTNAMPGVIERWKGYFPALARHEAGHAAIAKSAAVEIEAALLGGGSARDCAALQQRLNAAAGLALERHRRKDVEYDRETRHGATEGARFP